MIELGGDDLAEKLDSIHGGEVTDHSVFTCGPTHCGCCSLTVCLILASCTVSTKSAYACKAPGVPMSCAGSIIGTKLGCLAGCLLVGLLIDARADDA